MSIGCIIKQSDWCTVWRWQGWVYKRSLVELIGNEIRWLIALKDSGYVPMAQHLEKDVLRTKYLGDQEESWRSIVDTEEFLSHREPLLAALRKVGVRHGDLTEYAVIVVGNRPILIDFAQSKEWNSLKPDKRPGGDKCWLGETMNRLLEFSGVKCQKLSTQGEPLTCYT